MPVQQGTVGPIPEGHDPDEYDRVRRRVLWAMPSGLYVLGTRRGDQRNLMTLNWATQVSFDPKLIAVSVEHEAYTHRLLSEGKVFSLNLVRRDDRAIVRKFVKPVEADLAAHTLNGFAFHDGTTGAPVLDQAAAVVECLLRQEVPLGGHTLFIGEVVDAGFLQNGASDGSEDGGGGGGEILRMEDTRMSYGG